MAGRRFTRVGVRYVEAAFRRDWGFPPNLTRPLVEEFGTLAAVRGVNRHKRRYDASRRALGSLRTHLVCVTISLLNGSRYSAHGHAYAAELHYLERTDRLFPADAETIASWAGRPRAELRTLLRDLLMQADLHVELLWVDRTLDLADGSQRPIDEQEARIAHLVRLVGALNAVAVAHDVELDHQAHGPINKNEELKGRLAALRAATVPGSSGSQSDESDPPSGQR